NWKETLEQLVEREVVVQCALDKLATRRPQALQRLEEAASREFGRKWVRAARASAGLEDAEGLEAALRAQGTSLAEVRRLWQRAFIAQEYLRSRVAPAGSPARTRPAEATQLQTTRIVREL